MRPFRLVKNRPYVGWKVTCNVCDHHEYRTTPEEAWRRLQVLALRSRLITPTPCRECDDLAAQVDALALERDDLLADVAVLTGQLERAEQANADLRRNVKGAYEPVQVGDCRKVRHTSRDAAEQHAVQVAVRSPGSTLNAYQCRTCPPYPVTGERPWHAGNTWSGAPGSLHVERGVLHYWCGCKFSTSNGAQVWACTEHQGAAA